MLFTVLKETDIDEKRVALTPETAKKLIELGYRVCIEKNAGKYAGYSDIHYKNAGCKIDEKREKIIEESDIFLSIAPLSMEIVKNLPSKSVAIGMQKPYQSVDMLKQAAENNITVFSLELTPRITRAQTMDVLSSQSNLAGYKAIINAAAEYGRAFPLMMTAAGTISAARVLIIGAGVAGLQAIATARRLGAIVSAYDVRSAAKEQVESLGASFIEVNFSEKGDGGGGYAKEMSEEYKKAQTEVLTNALKKHDIVITTAQIPGKQAPILVTEDMITKMKSGSIIIDLSAETGGNCAVSRKGKTIEINGVKIIAPANILKDIASDASQLYARNLLNFIKNMYGPNAHSINWQDDIVKATCLTHDGKFVHSMFNE